MTTRDITSINTLQTLYNAFDKLNNHYFEGKLPTTILLITDTERKYADGWFTVRKIWTDDRDSHQMHEISISAKSLNKGSHHVIGVLLHEMIHLYCSENEIKDTSNEYVYHNLKFKQECEKRGLKFNQDKPCKVNGWFNTVLSEDGERIVDSFNLEVNAFAISRSFAERVDSDPISEINELVDALIKDIKAVTGDIVITKPKTRTEYHCPSCQLTFKGKKGLNLICGDCFCEFEINEE